MIVGVVLRTTDEGLDWIDKYAQRIVIIRSIPAGFAVGISIR